LDNLHRYPDGSCYHLTQALAERYGLAAEEVILGNGSNEIIEMLVKAFVQTGDEVITSHPSFLMYQKIVQVRAGINKVVPLVGMQHDLATILATITDTTRLIFLDNPNNPTGNPIHPTELQAFLSRVPESVLVVLDEAYVDFMDSELQCDIVALIRNNTGCGVVSLRTFSKAYGLAGLRVGYGLMPSSLVASLHKVRQPFNVNQLAQTGALAALQDEDFYQQTLQRTRTGLNYLQGEVNKLGCISYPSQTNFFLVDVHGDATAMYEAMLHKGVIIRSMKPYGYTTMVRITVGTEEENDRFLRALTLCLGELAYG
jgi:histidinol-phosphate aminotransferase